MPLFGIGSRSQKRSDRTQDSSSPSSSSQRPPLLPQTNLTMSTPEDISSSSSSSFSDDLDVSPSNHPFVGKSLHSEPDEPKSAVQSTRSLAPPPRTTQKMAYVNYSSMYMQNHLHTFSFGAPSSDSSSVHPIDPLSRPRDDSETDFVPIPDTTPRPSVVSTSHSPSCYQSQRPSQIKSSKGVGQIPHERDSDTASSHTFGTCSISSSSRPSGSRTNSSRSNTSDNDATSDEELGGRHPLPAEFSSPDISPVYRHTDQDVSSMYALEEEYDYNDDYDHDPEAGIEIDSVAHPGSDRCTIDYRNVSRESVPFDYAQKRGSEALPITTSSDRSYLENRIRENSVATLRRPSRSMDELRSFNFAQEVASSSLAPHTERSLPPSPTSVPGSEGDWRDLRKKSIQRDKDLPSISRIMANQHSSELHDFDPFWMHHRVNGVVGFDLSELNDIVGEDRTGCRSSNDLLRKDSEFGAYRRPSTASSGNVDIMYRRIIGPWATQKDRDQRRMWTFVKEHDRLPPEDIHTRQNIERERSSISSFFGSGSRPSSSATLEHGGILFFDGQNKEKAAGKEKAPKEIWRGMPLDSEEFWNNQATGRFRVYRRNTPCPEVGKPLQQRLNITFIRTPYVVNPITRDVLDGPAVTIHRHSKAGAFSISRHFRAKSVSKPSDTTSSSRRQFSFTDPSDGTRKKSNMILLGTRKVQKAYTSTTTTRRLESHGLLDGRPSPRDEERMKREYEREKRARTKAKDHEKGKGKDKKERDEKRKSVSATKKITNKEEIMPKDRKQGMPDSSGGSSTGSANALSSDGGVFVDSSTSVTTPNPSEGSSSFGSIEQSVVSHETASSDRTVFQTTTLYSYRRRHHPDDYDSSDDEGHRYSTRTPHRETYAVLPPEVFEYTHHHQEHPTHGLFNWGKSRGGNQTGHRPNPYEASYNPPWPVTTPRINSETRKGIVDDLNMSFQDVGLLPALGEINIGQVRRKREQQVHASRRQDQPQSDIFEGVPSDALCMLLPLWPGETDPASARKYPSGHPSLPPNSRQYILVYYKVQPSTVPPHEATKTKPDKKWSRGSPTSSHESTNKHEERGILLNNFYIIARIVSHRDLQGTGIRVPDVGLAVSGPLDIAYGNMPTDVPYGEYILGVCNSRDAGIDFLQDGFEKMGLSRNMPNPNPVTTNDDDESHSLDSVAVLTPLGRAVMEMAWLGGLALTSFNPAG